MQTSRVVGPTLSEFEAARTVLAPVIAVLNVMVGYVARGSWRTTPRPTSADVTSPGKATDV